ncbi:hypothetical protein [Thaumasiovibrio subtropicus]|uniref:hypothetical protein n=1 Tax=Thaumasiovibrio subtropicus TaxID=1891207 RepID=UPI000B34D18A|nr:hypothetical protein [Thaumasiovibrio subtropicus]
MENQQSQLSPLLVKSLAFKHVTERDEFTMLDCDIDALLLIQREEVFEFLNRLDNENQLLFTSYYTLAVNHLSDKHDRHKTFPIERVLPMLLAGF